MNGCCPQLPGFKPLEGGPAGLGRTHSQSRKPERFPLHTEGIRMKIQSLGHVVIKVRNQQRGEAFYNGLLGFRLPLDWRRQ